MTKLIEGKGRVIAAPEMLEMLKEINTVICQNHEILTHVPGLAYKIYRAEEIIAKAEGK